jgi:hypothetical protein
MGAVVPVVPVVVPVPCPHAGNANTKRKVRAAKIARKYGTYLSPLVDTHIACFTLVHWHKLCNFWRSYSTAIFTAGH